MGECVIGWTMCGAPDGNAIARNVVSMMLGMYVLRNVKEVNVRNVLVWSQECIMNVC